MIVLDTNVVSEYFRPEPDPRVVSWSAGLREEAAITSVTMAELLAGVHLMPPGRRRTLLAERLERFLSRHRDTGAVLPFDADAASHYGAILAMRQQAGLPIATADAQIAAICRSRAATLATRNTKDFDATGIAVVNPWLG